MTNINAWPIVTSSSMNLKFGLRNSVGKFSEDRVIRVGMRKQCQ
jgi:hypothetical protein